MTEFFQFVLLSLVLSLNSANAQWDPNFAPGRHVMVHLFEWKWADVAQECERYLGPKGFGGVQVSPPNENAVITSPYRPWWERYQPVSYKLETRSGNETEFADMVRRCNQVGVRIYVDAVINHMTGNSVKGIGTGGSSFDANNKNYSAVPYGPNDFNDVATCPTSSGSIDDYNNANQVRNCELSGLRDLNQGKEHVRQRIAGYLNNLVDLGVAGFRIDASKHMWPGDLQEILGRLNNLSLQHGFTAGTRPFVVQEVIDLGTEPIKGSEYFQTGRVTEFKYGMHLADCFRKLKNQKLKWLRNFGQEWAMYEDNKALVFIDNHDNQRGHGAGGENILTYRVARLYKLAQAFMLAWPYGVPRVMSSYLWELQMENGKDKNDWIGPPNLDGVIKDVELNSDGSCSGCWICEHRWRQIANMVQFRNVVKGTTVEKWWDNDNNQIAFSRGNKGFIAINNDNTPLTVTVQTSMEPGRYCDVISGDKRGSSCTGKTITVKSGGNIDLNISVPKNDEEDPMIAIHTNAKL